MPFPFWWGGALVAAIVLGTAFTLFGLATRLLTRAADEIRGSVLPGLVSGLRDWTRYPSPRRVVSSPHAVSSGPFSASRVTSGRRRPAADPSRWRGQATSRTDPISMPEPAVLEEVSSTRSAPTEAVLRR